tara:strand:- start:505 stop:1716 length:1212 start_codon:yes stop_codon:yes gene_type:complete
MKLINKLIQILISKKILKFPPKKEIFIYDENIFRSGYAHFFENTKCFIFETRYKELFLFLFLKAIFKKFFFLSHLPIFKIYTIEVIKVVNPKFLICFSHYTLMFWDLKKYFKDKIFIICQHHISLGYDGKYHPNTIVEARKKFKNRNQIDHIFLWGEAMINEFQKHLDGKFYKSGSIKNNTFKNQSTKNESDLLFMSQYHNWLNSNKTRIPLENGKDISKYEFNFKERKIVLNILYEYCLNKNLNLVIAPRQFNKKNYDEEKNYYEKILEGKKFTFLKRTKQFQVYEEFNRYKYFAVIDCSTGYEAMSRGKRVAHLNVVYDLSNVSGGRSHRYGWPGNFNLKGPFWTNEGNKEEIFRCLDFIFQTSDSEWEVVKKKFIDPIIIFDEENKNFKNNLKKIGLSIN